MRLLRTLILSLIGVCAFGLRAQTDSISVSLVNFYPGSIFYELEGHTVLRLQMPGADIGVSYGTFDFDAPNFLYRYVKGETDYWATAAPWELIKHAYAKQGRRIVEHPLLLDSAQSARAVEIAMANLRPENRTYRYNYVKDNCALRPLRLVQKALGDSIVLPATSQFGEEEHSFRDVMRYYHRNYPWYQFGIDLALGSGIDYPIKPWEDAFAPVLLDDQLPAAMVKKSDGTLAALCSQAVIVNEGRDATLSPTPWYLTPMAVGILVLLITIIVTIKDVRRQEVTKWLDAVLYSIFGIAGLVLTFLIFVSVHEATSPNYLYFWLNPLCLIVPIFIWLKKCNNVILSYQIVNFALLLVMCLGWHFFGQSGNPAFLPWVVCDMIRSLNYICLNIRR